ncbi:MAG TPA: signal peptide peptidase SppA [Candidatus Brocadiia bacterium]|nr:signal peptide peptidase SppA [Candidatus Brocadiia bacterium]
MDDSFSQPGGSFSPPPLPPRMDAGPQRIEVRVKQNTAALLVMVFIAGFFFLMCGALALALMAVAAGAAAMKAEGAPASSAPRYQEKVTLGPASAPDKILLLPVEGFISNERADSFLRERPGMADEMDLMLRQAESDPKVKCVLLSINTAGGSSTVSDMMHRRLMEYRKKTGAKVVALLGEVAASGGYYVASAADRIVAYPTCITGSIGVIMPLMNMKDLLDKVGVKPDPIKSKAMKDIGAFYRDMTDREREVLQRIVDKMYERFRGVVAECAARRGAALTPAKMEEVTDGRVFTGEDAMTAGLVDEVGFMNEAVDAARKLAGLDTAKVVTYAPAGKGLLALLESRLRASGKGEITIRVETPPWMTSSQPLYLWCPGLESAVRSDKARP